MKLFITGASGFVGGAIAKKMSRTHSVKAMARSAASAQKVKELGATPVSCDLNTVTEGDLHGIDIVIHAAARAEEWGQYESFYQANVIGTQRMLDAAKRAGVKRFIHIGTEAALFKGQSMENIDESYPYALDSPFPYAKTKALAEKAVLEASEPGFETLSLRPRLVWGPEDQSILPAVIDMIEKGTFAWINQGKAQTSTTHIDNIVHAADLALTKGKAGNAYFVCDGEVNSLRDFFVKLLATANVQAPEKSLPSWALEPLAMLVDLVWKVFRIQSKPPLTRMAVAMMRSTCTLDTSRASEDLGYQPVVTVSEGMMNLATYQTQVQSSAGMLPE